ncbi:TPA: thr operon leader peptide [Salmonella enterica subsp. diarizonae serovar 50:k:z]
MNRISTTTIITITTGNGAG